MHPLRAAAVQRDGFQVRLTIHHRGNPKDRALGGIDAAECGRRDSDDGHRMAVDQELATHHIRRPAEFAFPVVV